MDILRTFEVNGRVLKIASNEPEKSAMPYTLDPTGIAPGTGKFTIGSLELSARQVASGDSLSLSAHISGENIAYIYTEILFQDRDLDQSYGPVSQEYVISEKDENVQGVLYPAWDTDIKLILTITPSLRVLTDGVDSAFAFMQPIHYGQEGYQLDGLFAKEGSKSQRRAQLRFSTAGDLTSKLDFKVRGRHSTPHALTIKAGDQFTPYVQILTCSSDENPVWQVARGFSTTLTWRETAFRWVNEPLLAGDYLLGLVVQDFDGNQTRMNAPFTLCA